MSRSDYTDFDGDYWSLICWRGEVKLALRGKRGQAFLKELAHAMDAMPEKRLIDGDLEHNGQHCALGVVGYVRGYDMSGIDPDDAHMVSQRFGIAEAMAREIVYINDEDAFNEETPEERWCRVRRWVNYNILDSEKTS